MRFNKWHGIAGAVFVLFVTLLLIRLNVLNPSGQDSPIHPYSKTENAQATDAWMQVTQKGRKIGYVHRILMPEEGGYTFADDLFMRINTMGVVQGVMFSTRGTLHRDMTLATFQAVLSSNMFRFEAQGKVTGKTLSVWVRDGQGGKERRYDLTLNEAPSVPGSLAEKIVRSGLKKGESRIFHIFDAASMGVRPVKATLLGDDVVRLGNIPRTLTKISIEFLGARQFAWLDQEGRLVKEEGLLGLSLERVEQSEAKRGLDIDTAKGIDMTELASVASNVAIRAPHTLPFLKVKLSGIEDRRFSLSGGRQSYEGGILTIRKESEKREANPERGAAAENKDVYLQPSPFIQADHPEIIQAMKEIVHGKDDGRTKIKKVVHWVHRRLEKQPVLSVSNALETLRQRRGDCTEHAVLTAALARAAGIPATVETGLVYQRGRFYYHAWNVFWVENEQDWLTADAVFDQVPADVTHIRFVRGEMQEQLDLIGLIGHLQVEIME